MSPTGIPSLLHVAACALAGLVLTGCDPFYLEAPPDDTALPRLASGILHSCVLDDEGFATCWGRNTRALDVPLLGIWAAEDQTCGLTEAGGAVCWDDTGDEVLDFDGPLERLAVGGGAVCGLDRAGTPHCRAPDPDNPVVHTPDVAGFARITVGNRLACGLDGHGVSTCWGDPPVATPSLRLRQLALTTRDVGCAVTTDGALVPYRDGCDFLVPDHYRSLSVHHGSGCVLDDAGYPTCWGAVPTADEGPLHSLGVGIVHACALDEAGGVRCWGTDDDACDFGQVSDAPG